MCTTPPVTICASLEGTPVCYLGVIDQDKVHHQCSTPAKSWSLSRREGLVRHAHVAHRCPALGCCPARRRDKPRRPNAPGRVPPRFVGHKRTYRAVRHRQSSSAADAFVFVPYGRNPRFPAFRLTLCSDPLPTCNTILTKLHFAAALLPLPLNG